MLHWTVRYNVSLHYVFKYTACRSFNTSNSAPCVCPSAPHPVHYSLCQSLHSIKRAGLSGRSLWIGGAFSPRNAAFNQPHWLATHTAMTPSTLAAWCTHCFSLSRCRDIKSLWQPICRGNDVKARPVFWWAVMSCSPWGLRLSWYRLIGLTTAYFRPRSCDMLRSLDGDTRRKWVLAAACGDIGPTCLNKWVVAYNVYDHIQYMY